MGFLISKDSKTITDENIPKDIMAMVDNKAKAFNAGFVAFNFYRKSFEKLDTKLGYIVNFRFFTQFHIQSVKTCLHIKMNKRFKDLEVKLNNCKIINDDIMKGMETLSFFDQQQRKQEDMRNFREDPKVI